MYRHLAHVSCWVVSILIVSSSHSLSPSLSVEMNSLDFLIHSWMTQKKIRRMKKHHMRCIDASTCPAFASCLPPQQLCLLHQVCFCWYHLTIIVIFSFSSSRFTLISSSLSCALDLSLSLSLRLSASLYVSLPLYFYLYVSLSMSLWTAAGITVFICRVFMITLPSLSCSPYPVYIFSFFLNIYPFRLSLSLFPSLSLPICLLFLVCLLISLVSLSRALTFSSDHSRFRVLYVCFSLAYDLCCLLFSLSFADAPTLCILSLVSLPSLSNNTSFDVSSLSICLPLFH